MRSRWEVLHAEFVCSVESPRAVGAYQELQRRFPEFRALPRPVDVLATIAEPLSLEARDRILRPLARASVPRSTRPLSQTLLMLCLWPGLDSIYRRRLSLFRDADHLATELVDHFSLALQRLDLSRVACLTATLLRNTERSLLDQRSRDVATPPTEDPEPEDALPVGSGPSAFGLPDALPTDATIRALHAWLGRTVGEDADLVLHTVIFERSRDEVAAALGISCAAARKRLERALARARDAFLVEGQSQTAISDRPS